MLDANLKSSFLARIYVQTPLIRVVPHSSEYITVVYELLYTLLLPDFSVYNLGHYSENPYLITLIFLNSAPGLYTKNSG